MSFQQSPDSIAGIPLGSISAVVFDTETTGLDTTRDRVIEIGAVRLDSGHLNDAERYQAFVNPGIPIPSASTEVHHIRNQDVAGAPEFPAAMTAFADWTGTAVVMGYSVGFDLAILKAEHERSGLTWRMPRSVDVRHLVQLAAPSLPDQSLDTVAGWLELEVADRHRALGDAELTARVFTALVPKLRERGIMTMAQAERASRAAHGRMEEEAKAGWLEPGRPRAGAPSVAEYARIDSFPYRHRVADLMNSDALVIDNAMTLESAMALMLEKGVGSLFVLPDGGEAKHGILTERDIMRAINGEGAQALAMPASRFAVRPLVTIDSDEFVYRALTRMSGGGFRHLGVNDPDGGIAGALSMRDLLHQRAEDALSLGDSIEQAGSARELGRIWPDLTNVARALTQEDVDARDIATVISRELRALTKRACELAEMELDAAGRGPAPAPFALLVLGSAGRGESLLAMDQDNAIIHGPVDAAGADWFKMLGTRVTDILNEAGVVYCKGGVMASNDAWRMDLEGWRSTVRSWIGRSRPEDILNCDIFFDAAPVHGDLALADTLRSEALSMASDARTFLHLLAHNARDFDEPTGWFGRFRLKEGRIDLKRTGLMPLFSAARVAALEHAIPARSTPERLRAAHERGVASDRTINNLIDAHGILLDQILRQQLRDIAEGIALSNTVAPAQLDGSELQQLKWALEQVPGVADVLGTPLLG